MKALNLFGLYGGGMLVVVFFGVFVIGMAAGAGASSLGEVTLDPANESYYVNGSEVNTIEPEGPLSQFVDPEDSYVGSTVDPVFREYMANVANDMIRTTLHVSNFGAAIGFANRSWMSPAWVMGVGQVGMLLGIVEVFYKQLKGALR